MRSSIFFALALGLLLPFASSATTIIPFKHLAELYLASDAVALVHAGTPYHSFDNNCTHNDCNFTVMVSAKGPMVAGDNFSLRQYSYYDAIGHLDITGDFVPKDGHNYLVFLDQDDNGSWRLMTMSYYVFEESIQGNEQFLVPVAESLSMGVFPRPDGVLTEPLTAYRESALLQLLQQQDKGPAVPWDPSSAQVPLNTLDHSPLADRAIPTGCDFDLGGGLSRWQNPTINLYYDVTNVPADGVARFQATISTLNSEYTGLNLIYGGSTDFTPDCSDMSVAGQDFIDFLNNNLNGNQSILLLFDDPCNQIPDLVNCSGVLAMGGGYMLSTSHVYKGDTWKNAAWGYVFTNNGVRPCLTATNYERLLTHELTHSLKMDHLDAVLYPNNNMNPTCCNAVNTKDRECMNYVYASALPVELISFDARALENAVTLSWSTAQETNNDHFIVERSTDGFHFEQLATISASNLSHAANYTLTDDRPLAGINYYRLSQMDRDGQTEQLAMRAVTYRGKTGSFELMPNPVNTNTIRLSTADREITVESVQIFSAAGSLIFQLPVEVTGNSAQLDLPVGDLPAGVYWLKVNTAGHAETMKFVRL